MLSRAAVHFLAADPLLAAADDPSPTAAASGSGSSSSSLVAAAQFRSMVSRLHAAGVEVLLQMEPTFTAEGTDAAPATLSMRGLDYGAYYRSNGVRALPLLGVWGGDGMGWDGMGWGAPVWVVAYISPLLLLLLLALLQQPFPSGPLPPASPAGATGAQLRQRHHPAVPAGCDAPLGGGEWALWSVYPEQRYVAREAVVPCAPLN